jgi:hypothetical protein
MLERLERYCRRPPQEQRKQALAALLQSAPALGKKENSQKGRYHRQSHHGAPGRIFPVAGL